MLHEKPTPERGEPGERTGAPGRPQHGDQGMKNKAPARSPVTKVVGEGWCPDASAGESRRGEAAAVEERGRWGPHKGPPRWWWHAIDHLPGVVRAEAFGSRAEEGCGA